MRKAVQTYIDHLQAEDAHLADLVAAGGIDEEYYLKLNHTYVFDLKGKCIFATTAAARALGVNRTEIIGKNCLELPLPLGARLNLERFYNAINFVVEKGTSLTQEASGAIPTTRGKRYCEYHMTPFREEGVMKAVLCSVRDITDRKEVELQYQGEAAKLRRLVEICPLPIIAVDRDSKVVAINQSYFRSFPPVQDLSMADIIGKPFQFIGDRLCIPFDKSVVGRVLASGKAITNEYGQICEREWLINAIPIAAPATDEVAGAMVIFLEVTEFEAWRLESGRIDRLRLISEMATGVAHEIRNPMTVIQGFLQVLMSRSNVKQLDYFQMILGELDQINAVVTEFLSMATNKAMEKNEQNLNDIIHSIYPLIFSDITKHGVEIDVRLDGNLPKLLLDEREIKQLIKNLVRNSVEAMNGKGKLLLKTSRQSNTVELVVSDNGCGIEPDKLEKIFDPFYTTKEEGTGLGLPVCQGIAHRHDGIIRVNSQVGKGTQFTVVFNCILDKSE